MAISFVGSSNVSNGILAGTSAVVPRPPGVANGDTLLVFVSIGHAGAITAPAGWAEVPLGTVAIGATLQNRCYTKVAAGEPVSWTWTFASSPFVGIGHATRGVALVYAAQQSDGLLALLVHTTPVLAAPAGAWLVSTWAGRSLLALGWGAPAGDVERQDVVGGLLILLNVNHAVDDTNAPVVAGNYSKTAATLVAVRSLAGLVVLAPVLDPLLAVPVDGKALFGAATVGVGVLLSPVDTFSDFGTPTVGVGLVSVPVVTAQDFGLAAVVPGEVFLFPGELDTSYQTPDAQVVPGEVVIGGMPLITVQDFGTSDVVPGEIVLMPAAIPSAGDFDGPHDVMLGFAISDFAIDFYAVFADVILGQQIGSDVTPFLIPNPFVADTFEHLPAGGLIFNSVAASGPCC